jgi:hypothetical protein
MIRRQLGCALEYSWAFQQLNPLRHQLRRIVNHQASRNHFGEDKGSCKRRIELDQPDILDGVHLSFHPVLIVRRTLILTKLSDRTTNAEVAVFVFLTHLCEELGDAIDLCFHSEHSVL